MEDITIRFIHENEIPELNKLCKLHAAFEKAKWEEDGKNERLLRDLFQADPPLKCLVAVSKNKIIGYATYMKQYSTWDADYYLYMDCLFLTEESRGYGVGQRLIDRIKTEGSRLGINCIQWQTPEFNKRAVKFYQRIGAVGKSKERFFLESASNITDPFISE